MKVNKKYIRCITSFCAVVIALVMCVGMFSITAHAENSDNYSINLDYKLYHPNTGGTYVHLNANIDNHSKYLIEHEPVASVPMDYAMQLQFTASVVSADGSLLVKSGEIFDFSITGLNLHVGTDSSMWLWNGTPGAMYVGLVHTDGTCTYMYDLDWVYSSGSQTHAIKVKGTAEKDVIKIVFFESIGQNTVTGLHTVTSAWIGMGDIETPTAIDVEIESKEVGLLENIAEKIDSGLSDVGDKIDSGFSDVLNGSTQQNQQAQDAVGDLNSSTDKLGQLGDTMASVEKPSIDSSKISADSLVPKTSLVVLSSPFQALWENNQLLAMLTIVVTLVLVSWVFFGKKA